MADALTSVEIPDRALFKAAEVCDLVKLQPYVLRSWEAEFPALGVARAEGGPRVYRRVDVEQVARIKHLLLVEGLTLAGARRKLQEEASPVAGGASVLEELIGQHARVRLAEVKRGLQSILELLTARASSDEFQLSSPVLTAESTDPAVTTALALRSPSDTAPPTRGRAGGRPHAKGPSPLGRKR
jgi:DNA-binding transcriptional MerR regulator